MGMKEDTTETIERIWNTDDIVKSLNNSWADYSWTSFYMREK